MTKSLAILTPSPDEPRFAAIAQQWFERLQAPLAAIGIDAQTRHWTSPGDLGAFDGVSPLLAWSYHVEPVAWSALLDQLAASGKPVANSVDVLRWNTRKTYLAELEAAGAPVIPTLFVDVTTPQAIAEAHDRFGAEIIVKPQVSGGSYQTTHLTKGQPLAEAPDELPDGPAMLQPFLPAVRGEGELSLLYFDGVFSHAVGKVAQADDFRVQVQHGGQYRALTAPPEALEVAGRVLAAAARPLTYARIDLLRGTDGRLQLMELEAIEPDLYLEHAPDGGAAFARAMLRGIGG